MRKSTLTSMALAALIAGFVWLVCPAPAAAQDEEAIQKLMRFAANNPDFDDQVTRRARALFTHQVAGCEGKINQLVRQLPTAYGDITFIEKGDDAFPPPVSGIWIEHVKVRACGHVYQINMLSAARRKGMPVLLGILPGDTLSDPASQRDAERVGSMTIKRADTTCAADAQAMNTRLIGFIQDDNTVSRKKSNNGWFEEWAFDFCHRTVALQMAFMPNESGGYDIRARLADGAAEPRTPEQKPAQ